MDRWHLITVFVAVVDHNGFAAAARKLAMSPPAVTRGVNELEAHLGVRLLTRTTRVVRVTEPGARYAEDCRLILAQLAEADESVTGTHSTPRGRLTITAPVMFGVLYVVPIVTDYLRQHTEVCAACWFLDRVVNMTDEGADVAVRIGAVPGSSLQVAAVGSVRRVICAAPANLERHGTPQLQQDLHEHVIVSTTAGGSGAEWTLAQAGETCVIQLRPRLTTTGIDSAIAAVLGGFGVTRVLSYQVAEHLSSGRLVTVLNAFELPAMPVQSCAPRGAPGLEEGAVLRRFRRWPAADRCLAAVTKTHARGALQSPRARVCSAITVKMTRSRAFNCNRGTPDV